MSVSPPRQQDSDLSDHEEEFYYTECDVALESISDGMAGLYASSPPTLSHMDMARPPHEDPQYQRQLALRATGGDPAAAAAAAAPIPIPGPRQSWTAALWTTVSDTGREGGELVLRGNECLQRCR